MGTFQQLWLNYKPRNQRHLRSPSLPEKFDWTDNTEIERVNTNYAFLFLLVIIFTHYLHTPFWPCLHYHELGDFTFKPRLSDPLTFLFFARWEHSERLGGRRLTSAFYNFNFNAFSTPVSGYNRRERGNMVGISPNWRQIN